MEFYWQDLLKERYPMYKVEEKAFAESLKVCNSAYVSADKIYQAIKDDADVATNLKALYREAIYGTNKEVKSHIKSRIGNIRRNTRYVKSTMYISLICMICINMRSVLPSYFGVLFFRQDDKMWSYFAQMSYKLEDVKKRDILLRNSIQ